MAYTRTCDYCGERMPVEKSYPILVRVEKSAMQITLSSDNTELCSWNCVVDYAMQRGGVAHA